MKKFLFIGLLVVAGSVQAADFSIEELNDFEYDATTDELCALGLPIEVLRVDQDKVCRLGVTKAYGLAEESDSEDNRSSEAGDGKTQALDLKDSYFVPWFKIAIVGLNKCTRDQAIRAVTSLSENLKNLRKFERQKHS